MADDHDPNAPLVDWEPDESGPVPSIATRCRCGCGCAAAPGLTYASQACYERDRARGRATCAFGEKTLVRATQVPALLRMDPLALQRIDSTLRRRSR